MPFNFNFNKKLFRYFGYDILIACCLLVGFGIFNIYNGTKASMGTYYLKLQSVWLILGIIVVGVIILIDYVIISNYAPVIYWFSILLLIANRFVGSTINGATGWIKLGSRAIQPSEFAKMALIIMLAKKINDMDGEINNLKNFLVVCFYALIPMALIVVQPDMGMTMVTFFTVLGIVFIAGLDMKVIVAGMSGIILTIVGIWNSPIMKPYWKARLISFLNPEDYARDYGYQVINAIIGIGSGGVTGMGLGMGNQHKAVPESHTDFIFAVIAEEWGIIGGIILLIFYAYIIIRILNVSTKAKDTFGKLVCAGIAASFLFSVFQNMGMTVQLMPVTGITLPMVSYGGSSMLSNFIGIGLVLNIGMRRKKINF